VKNLALAPAGFAIKIRQNSALAGFGKSKFGTTLLLANPDLPEVWQLNACRTVNKQPVKQ